MAESPFPAPSDREAPHGNADAGEILQRIDRDNGTAAAQLLPIVYDELRRLAALFMRQERTDHTLQPTALVHEAYVRLIQPAGSGPVDWTNRSHFFGVAATAMRRVLVDHARARSTLKRGGDVASVALDEAVAPLDPKQGRIYEVLELDEALTKLGELDATMARVVELRFFGGLTIEETAAVLGVGHGKVEGKWAFAKAWLARKMSANAT